MIPSTTIQNLYLKSSVSKWTYYLALSNSTTQSSNPELTVSATHSVLVSKSTLKVDDHFPKLSTYQIRIRNGRSMLKCSIYWVVKKVMTCSLVVVVYLCKNVSWLFRHPNNFLAICNLKWLQTLIIFIRQKRTVIIKNFNHLMSC